MAVPNLRTPSYRLHKPTGQAVVTLDGRDFYLGRHGSPESYAEYNRLVAEWLANGRKLPSASDLTVCELIPPYVRHCEQYYVKNGKVTNQVFLIKVSIRVLRKLYGETLVKDFGPLALKACRSEFIRQGLSRRECNRRTNLIKQMFRWATENELAPAGAYHALQAVAGLRKGRCEAPDPEPIGPVPDEHVEAVLPHLTPTVRAMVQVQLWSGMRPEEVTRLRAADLTMSGPAWLYRPESHKTEHHDKERVVILGPRVQAILRERLTTDLTSYLFRPGDGFAERIAEQRKRPGVGSGEGRSFGGRYSVPSYRRAIHRACDRAGVPRWSPNRLRHACATRVRREFGLDVAKAVLGHSSVAPTQIYAEQDMEAARRAMEKLG